MSFVAISKVKYPVELKRQIHAVGCAIVPIAKLQPGLISIAFHESSTSDETMMYWEWETISDHEACMQSAEWSSLMECHQSLFASEGVELTLETYNRLA